jgi:hypothetical protein
MSGWVWCPVCGKRYRAADYGQHRATHINDEPERPASTDEPATP